MIRVGNLALTLYVGNNAVKEAFLGAIQIYPDKEPVITVEYSEWTTRSLALSASGSQIPASGGSVSVSAVARQVRTKTTLSDGVPVATEQETRDIAVTPSLSSNNAAFRVSGATVSCENRRTVEGDRISATITGRYDEVSDTLTLYQEENRPVSYAYRVEVVSSGGTIAWGGGTTSVSAKSQRAATYTSKETGDYYDTTAQTIAARIVGSGFSIGTGTNTNGVYSFPVTAAATSSTSQRTATVTFTGSTGGSASATVRQAAMPLTYGFRYKYSNRASQYPRFAVNGGPGDKLLRAVVETPTHVLYYENAVEKVQGSTTSYLSGIPKLSQVGPAEAPYIAAGYEAGWSNNYAMGFVMGQQGNFMNNYPYTYVSSAFTLTGTGFSLAGIALFEKNYNDAGGDWYLPADTAATVSLSAAEKRAVQLLAKNGVATEADDPMLTGMDFEVLADKINALRLPDTNRYIQNEDGSWTTLSEKTE